MENFQMIPIVIKIINWFSNNIRIVAVGLVSLLIATVFVQHNQLQKKDTEINRITSNVRTYQDIVSNNQNNNRTLQLTIEELNHSNDSLLLQLKQTQKELKIKDKNLTNANVINTEIKDSVKTVIKKEAIDFKEELKLNPLTTIIVERKDSILTAKIDLKNQQTILIYKKKKYKNFYKNGWVRFWHFDWKKIETKEYQIVNTNPLIKVTGTRIVEVPK